VQKVHGAEQMAAERDKENNVVSDITVGYYCSLRSAWSVCVCAGLNIVSPAKLTRSSATAEGLRDAVCQSKSCQLLHNSVGTN